MLLWISELFPTALKKSRRTNTLILRLAEFCSWVLWACPGRLHYTFPTLQGPQRYEVSEVISCSVSLMLTLTQDTDIIWIVSTKNREFNLRNSFCTLWFWEWGFHAKPVMYLLFCWWRRGELFWPKGKCVACEEVCLGGLGVGGNYIWCVAIVVTLLMGLRRAKRWEVGGRFYSHHM